MNRVVCVSLTLAVFLITSAGPVREGAFAGKKELFQLKVSQKVLRLLKAEMNSVQNGMSNLSIAIPAGRWSDIIETARLMRRGYIMDRKLSEDQKREFQAALPQGYRDIDKTFLAETEKMTVAAEQRDINDVNRHFQKLMGTCISCHESYAEKRFPELVNKSSRDK